MSLVQFYHTKEDDNCSDKLSLEQFVNPIINTHYPALLDAVHASLSVFATLSFKNRTKPLSVIFEASSGFGKTAVLQMAFPLKDSKDKHNELRKYVYRSDKFTPKSFVSHAANVKKALLKDVDMLPRVKNKVLITKELAPIFRGREQDIKENFSILISILDGKGFTSDSGTMGQRGYEESIIFNWLGATTPLPINIHRIMSQLGTRLLFFEVKTIEPTEEQLFAYAERGNAGKAEIECNIVVNKFLINFYKCYPIGSIEADSIRIPSELNKQIVRWAGFLVRGRAEIKYEKDKYEWIPIAANKPEGAWKVIDYFKELARGRALINNRMEVNSFDLDFIAHIAISSIPIHFRPIVRELRISEIVDSTRCQELCAVSRPTARKYLKELSLLGIVDLTKGEEEKNEADKITLSKEFLWMRQ
ncbi:MAG TPA: hypothetical protein VNI02_18070 [Blastocatellia bacterium]|jgi:hypothetical protein|nr:hypothetical protein [Blastocatellia bacterium]